jgi:hypothetical protein
MNRPSSFDFLLGHRAAVWLTTGATGVSALAWLSHGTSWLVPLVALAARNGCLAASGRVGRYRRWAEAWVEMAGTGEEEPGLGPSPSRSPAADAPKPAEPKPARRKPRPIPRSALILAWLLLLGWFTARRNEPPTEPRDGLLALCCVVLSIWGALAGVASLLQRVLRTPAEALPRSGPEPEPGQDVVVTQCLPLPPAPQRAGHHVTELLPDYARELLARSRAAIPPATSHSGNESEKSQ